jgi:HSP20 family protein
MTRRHDPADWMWAHAVELMDQAERMHRQFFRLASSKRREQAKWEPPVDVFEDEDEVAVVVALPGVTADRVEVSSEGSTLVVRAERPVPFSGSRCAVRQLEIPYGSFERRVALPRGPFEAIAHELIHGCLVVRLRKANR